MGERIRKAKGNEFVGWNKGNILGKRKAMCTSKAKQETHNTIRHGDVQHVQQDSSHVMVSLEDKHHHCECPSILLLSSQALLLNMMGRDTCYGTSLWPAWASSPGCISSQLPSHLFVRASWGTEKSALCEHCSATNKKTLLCYDHYFH